MRGFIDASVIVAILGRESDATFQQQRLADFAGDRFVSPLIIYEATLSLARAKAGPGVPLSLGMIQEARRAVLKFVESARAADVVIDRDIGEQAIDAAMTFGKTVRHPAALNLGDCFAYACAKTKRAVIFHKGDDFPKTDLPVA